MAARKKHSAVKRINRHAQAIVRQYHMGVFYSYNDNQMCNLIDIRHKRLLNANRLITDMLTTVKYRWSVLCVGVCETEDGTRYMKAEQVSANEPYLQEELSDLLNAQHEALLKSCNEKHLRNACWLASPTGVDWDESEAFDLLEQLGAWDDIHCERQSGGVADGILPGLQEHSAVPSGSANGDQLPA